MAIWIDTDFGFDDLWALLLLQHQQIAVGGISLVAGNTPLPQVRRNADASVKAFGFTWPIYSGADKPLQREPETAQRILGELGMQSRGLFLPYSNKTEVRGKSAIDAMVHWLNNEESHQIVALGPLTNLAQLVIQYPDQANKVTQITWLGGSCGRGNHSEFAEYNAFADAEALDVIAQSNIPFRLIDLELCRQVTFGESDIPAMQGKNKKLISDLLGGYLDIALQRGRRSMAIYDPLAVLAFIHGEYFQFAPASMAVNTQADAQYGQTVIDVSAGKSDGNFEIAVNIDVNAARDYCLSALVNV